jgi:ethanolamine-phosphate cytidylyltransferase
MVANKTRIYVDGVFDLTHYGHYKLFKQAKELGDILIVGVLSDEECEKYKRAPILTEEERAENIRCCGYVDTVIGGVPNIVTKEFIEKYNIDIVAHAHILDDHEKYKYQYIDAINMGIFKRLNYTSTISTTDIINRIKRGKY